VTDRSHPKRRALPLVEPGHGQAALEAPTIMDRALAAQYGSAYVQLAAFAIDVDRAYVTADELEVEPAPPFAWEVFVTEAYLLARLDPRVPEPRALLGRMCLELLEQDPEAQGFGSQILFAAHDAIARGFYPRDLGVLFHTWRKRPKQLHKALDALWAAPAASLAGCAAFCLSLPLDPRPSPPTREALEQMRDGAWPLPAATTEPGPT
jgi:hypothetical protein